MASIKERNGKYCVIYNYVNPKGKRKQKWETYTTKALKRRRRHGKQRLSIKRPTAPLSFLSVHV